MKLIKGFIRSSTYLFLVIALLQLSCCDKSIKGAKCQGFVPISQKVKDYFLFKDSSYWIYQDSVNGQRDSVYVNGNLKPEPFWAEEIVGQNSPCYEQFKYFLRSNFNKDQRVYLTALYQKNPVDTNTLGYEIIYNTLDGSFSDTRVVLFGTDSLNTQIGLEGSTDFAIQYLPSYTLKGKKYDDIIYLEYTKPNIHDFITRIYYAKYIGIIKYEMRRGPVWELIRYGIKQ